MDKGNYYNQGLYETNTVQQEDLGTTREEKGNRVFVYQKAGGALTPGLIARTPALAANHINMATTAHAIGVTKVTVTLGATAATKDQYLGGLFMINDVAGEGGCYVIKSNPAAASGATCQVELEEPLKVALTTGSQITFMENAYQDVAAATAVLKASGVPLVSVASGSYFWGQVRGVANVLIDGVPTEGGQVIASTSVAGAAAVAVSTDILSERIGHMMVVGIDTEYKPVFLNIG